MVTAHSTFAPQSSKDSPSSRVLGARLSTSDNALNLVRLVMALAVIVAHTGPFAGDESWSRAVGGLGGWAVGGFFAISGYLIVGSRLRSSWYSYTIRRVARIYPGYWVQLLIVAMVFAPLATLLSPSTWSLRAAWDYMAQNVSTFGLTYMLEGTEFVHFDAWNGSTWTLMYELLAYLACLVLFGLPWARRHVTLVSAVLFLMLTAFNFAAPALDVTTNMYLHAGRLGAFFVAGALAFALRDRIRAHWSLLAVSTTIVIVLYFLPDVGYLLGPIPLTYAVLAAGALLPWRLGAENDISYGVYIYGAPVQQMCTFIGLDRIGALPHLLAATAVTCVLGWLSWSLVEKPAMDLARSFIGRIRQRFSGSTEPRLRSQ